MIIRGKAQVRNPGLKHLASPPPMKQPHTLNSGGYGVPPEPSTIDDDVMEGPPTTGGSSSNAVSVDNGDEGGHDVFNLDTSYPDKTNGLPNTYLAGVAETLVPGNVRQHANLPDIGQENAAKQRRIEHQQQVGGGAWENPAYEEAQDDIREKMQRRRAHPLHQGAYDWDRKEFLYDVDKPDYFVRDPPPSAHHLPNRQPMFDVKSIYDGEDSPDILDQEYRHPGYPACRGCIDHDIQSHDPDAMMHKPGRGRDIRVHEYQPIEDLPPGARLATHGPKEKEDMRTLLDIQGAHGNWDYNDYMHGMYNGMELMRATADGDEPEFRDAPDQWGEDMATWRPAKPGETPGQVEPDDAPAEDPRLVRSGKRHPLFHTSTQNENSYGIIIEITPGERDKMTAVAMLKKATESDEEFWARMEREHPGGQVSTRTYQPVGPDSAGQEFTDDDILPHPSDHPDEWTDTDWDEMIPENMSLREHAHMLRSPGYRWDGDFRYPKYTSTHHRDIVDSDGRRGFGVEGHVIEHNTGHHGPVLPTADDPEPDALRYPWSHTYYPAGLRDEEGLVKGYNSPDEAVRASQQLSLHGARHPKSKELLNSGYRYVGSEMPYDPSKKLPHEAIRITGFNGS